MREKKRKEEHVGGCIILWLMLRRYDGVVWTGLVWLRIRTSGELLWIGHWTFWFHKMLGIYQVAAQLVLSQLHRVVWLVGGSVGRSVSDRVRKLCTNIWTDQFLKAKWRLLSLKVMDIGGIATSVSKVQCNCIVLYCIVLYCIVLYCILF
jgi:hypothetical protein